MYMEKELIFHILNIAETKDEDEIAMAYRSLLKNTNPEDDPEGFKRLRQAYEEALDYARHGDDGEEDTAPKNDVDLWIDRIDEVYKNLDTRKILERWKELFSDSICEGLDTSIEAREKMIVYLMSHYYLPHNIWKLIDDTFGITDDIPALSQQFPADFLNYVKFHVDNDTFIPYELFQYINSEEDGNADAYIGKYLDVKGKIDNGELDGCLKELDDLRAYGIYHPFEDAERIRALIRNKENEKALNLADRLLSEYGEYTYIQLYAGEAKWEGGQKEDARKIWEDILKKQPEHYMAKYNLIKYKMDMGDYYQAKENMIELLEISGRDDTLESWMSEANEYLIKQYREEIENGVENPNLPGDELKYELGWCLFQNEKYDEAIEYLDKFDEEQKSTYEYCNLYGRLLYEVGKYEEALPYLENWLKIITELVDDGTDETKKRMSRRGRAGHILGGCYFELGRLEDCEKTLRDAIAAMNDLKEQLACRQYLAYTLMKGKQYEKAVDICDGIIKDDSGYYPAYLIRQESCYELKRGQDVVDDYYNAIDIVPGYFQPYMYAAEVFFFFSQYNDAKGVYELARKNGVEFSDRMKLYEAKVLRNLAESKEDREKIVKILEELKNNLEQESCDIEDKSEVDFEIGLLAWDDGEFKRALEYMKKAIMQNPKRQQYRMVRGNIYQEMGKYKNALDEYNAAKEEYEGDPGIWYNRGVCYENMGFTETAMELYEKSLERQEGYRDACEKLSKYYEDKYYKECKAEDFKKAVEYMDRQLKVTQESYYYVCRGCLYLNNYQFEPAISDFEKALEYSDKNWHTWNSLGCCYKNMGESEKAIKYFKKSAECMGDNYQVYPYNNMADCYRVLEDYQAAIECYKKNLEMFPDKLYYWEEIGDIYSDLGEYEKAMEAYEKAGNGALQNIGDLWYQRGDKKKCIRYYKKAYSEAEAKDKAEYMADIGYIYKAYFFEYKKAIECYKRALKMDISTYYKYEYENAIASVYYMLGDFKKAQKHGMAAFDYFKKSGNGLVEDYISYGPKAPVRLRDFGWMYLCMGMKDKAIECFDKMEKLVHCRGCRHKECFESRLHKGYMYTAEGDYEKALEELREALNRNPYSYETKYVIENIQKVKGKK